MGTTSIAMPADKKAFLDREMTSENGSHAVLKSSFVGSTYYAAIKITKQGESSDDSPVVFVLGAVIKTNCYQGEFYFKSMDETAGPVQSQCPPGILKLLTPLDDLERLGVVSGNGKEWAAKWRERCRKHAEAKRLRARLKEGSRIKLPYTVRFNNGTEGDTFVKVDVPQRRNVFGVEGESLLVRLSSRHLNDAELLA